MPVVPWLAPHNALTPRRRHSWTTPAKLAFNTAVGPPPWSTRALDLERDAMRVALRVVNGDPANDPCNDALRARVVGMQTQFLAEVKRQKLGRHDIEWRAQPIRKPSAGRRNRRVEIVRR